MLNVTKELTALARKLGYTGNAPDTVAKAINAITSVAGSSSGGGGVFIIETEEIEDNTGTALRLNKTWKEIDDALMEGKNCIVIMQNELAGIIHCSLVATMANSSNSRYAVMAGSDYFYASSENYYPVSDNS